MGPRQSGTSSYEAAAAEAAVACWSVLCLLSIEDKRRDFEAGLLRRLALRLLGASAYEYDTRSVTRVVNIAQGFSNVVGYVKWRMERCATGVGVGEAGRCQKQKQRGKEQDTVREAICAYSATHWIRTGYEIIYGRRRATQIHFQDDDNTEHILENLCK